MYATLIPLYRVVNVLQIKAETAEEMADWMQAIKSATLIWCKTNLLLFICSNIINTENLI